MCRNITWETETDLIIIHYNGEYIRCYGKSKDHSHGNKEELSEQGITKAILNPVDITETKEI